MLLQPCIPHILLLLFLLLIPLTIAEHAQQSRARHNILSAYSPITKLLSTQSLKPAVTELQALIQTLSHTIDTRIANNDTQACNLRGIPWMELQEDDVSTRGLGSLQRTCQSQLIASAAEMREELPQHFFQRARGVLRDGAIAIGAAGTEFVQQQQRLKWRGVHAARGWDLMKGGQTCTLETATAYRVRGLWYLRAVVTNHPVDAFQPDWQRQYVEELLPPDFEDALQTVHPAFNDGEDVNGTTVLLYQGGKATFSSVAMGSAENPALVEALRLNELAVDQARDAVTPSNIAILALPMIMAVLPVAFVAELNTCATLLYILFTDVFSALPFLIKGIELTTTGVSHRGELVAYHVGNTELGVLEVWAAECHGQDSFRKLGISFTIVALVTMIGGIGLEIYAWRLMKRKGLLAKGPFGEVHRFQLNEYTVLERTVDEFDGEDTIKKGRRRWRIRPKRRSRDQQVDDDDDDDKSSD